MTALTNDAALIAAWERYTVARAVFSVLPVGQCADGEHHTPAELEQLAIIEPAEKEIAAAMPTTIRGLEIKLWFALAQNINQSEVDVLCALREAERHFRESGELDWCDKIVFSTIQSLRALQGAKVGADWGKLRDAFENAAKNLPDAATDEQLDDYWAKWADAMRGEANDLAAIRWKIEQYVKEGDAGGWRDDLAEAYTSAILADVERFAAGRAA